MTRVVERNPGAGGRDWIVGDVHGCFQTLRQALAAIDFEHGRDRLFSAGDLIDRGPNSIEALAWLEAGRFDAVVMGNHEAEMVRLLLLLKLAILRLSTNHRSSSSKIVLSGSNNIMEHPI